MTADSSHPIGVLDSGFGGLSVLRALRQQLPHENFVYIADCENAPWGDKDDESLEQRILFLVDRLLRKEVKVIVLACNTASTMMHKTLEKMLPIPVIGIMPPLALAKNTTRNGKVGLMATQKTVHSKTYNALRRSYKTKIDITDIACSGLMERVEMGDFTSEATQAVIRELTAPLKAAQVDTIALACTHYPFLIEPLQKEFPDVTFVEPSGLIAKKLANLLTKKKLHTTREGDGTVTYITSGPNATRDHILSTIVGEKAHFLCLE